MTDQIACLRIELAQIDPCIWRRIEVRLTSHHRELHETIEAVMPWEGYHLGAWPGGVDTEVRQSPLSGALEVSAVWPSTRCPRRTSASARRFSRFANAAPSGVLSAAKKVAMLRFEAAMTAASYSSILSIARGCRRPSAASSFLPALMPGKQTNRPMRCR